MRVAKMTKRIEFTPRHELRIRQAEKVNAKLQERLDFTEAKLESVRRDVTELRQERRNDAGNVP